MSWEVFGTSGDDESIGADELYNRGWESDDDAEKWWREEHPRSTPSLKRFVPRKIGCIQKTFRG